MKKRVSRYGLTLAVLIIILFIIFLFLIFFKDDKNNSMILSSPPEEMLSSDNFIWGFNLVGGTNADFSEWPISEDEIKMIKKDTGMNTMRFFVHPSFVGLPYTSWAGYYPDPNNSTLLISASVIDFRKKSVVSYSYSSKTKIFRVTQNATYKDYNWTNLDIVLDMLYRNNITPVMLPFAPDYYMSYIYLKNLTGNLNRVDSNPSWTNIYGDINPEEQVRIYFTDIARHINQKYSGKKFYFVGTEIAGQTIGDGAVKHSGEKEAWQSVVKSVKFAAPNMQFFSPEVIPGVYWNWNVRMNKNCIANFDDLIYNSDWPRADYIENYVGDFDYPAISAYAMTTPSEFCRDINPVFNSISQIVRVARNHFGRENKIFWSESGGVAGDCISGKDYFAIENFHASWASILLAGDNLRGILLWHAKDARGTGCGLLQNDGSKSNNYNSIEKLSEVIRENYKFFSSYHDKYNSDGLPIEDNFFIETDSQVLSRYLGNHLVIFSFGPSEINFTNARHLAEFFNSESPLSFEETDSGIVVSNLVANRTYVLEVSYCGDGICQKNFGETRRLCFNDCGLYLSSFNFEIRMYKKLFAVDENISLDYDSDISKLKISAILTYPDGGTEKIAFPQNIEASQIGEYSLEVTASKFGYKTIKVTEQFEVVEDAKINGANKFKITNKSSNPRNIYSSDINKSRKIGDVSDSEIDSWGNLWAYLIFLILILIGIIIFFLAWMKGNSTKR